MDKNDRSEDLNPQQVKAVTHGDGPLLVVAGAGSGKTRTLAYRVAHLIDLGVQPQRILLLTFTRRAAQEMLKRASAAIKDKNISVKNVWSGTFHAVANRLLRIYADQAGLPPDFTIIDRSDAEDFIDVIRHDLGYSKKDRRFPRKATCLPIYSRRVNGDEDLKTVVKKYFPWCEQWQKELNELFGEYVKRKQRQNVLDYDDLLLYWYFMLQSKSLAGEIGERFDHILVDEYQDTNRVQSQILTGMRQDNSNIMAVGDDAQSIYSFRSATVKNMLDFPKHFPGTTIVTLEQNYRSLIPILNSTNKVITQTKNRYTKDLWSEREGTHKPGFITCLDENYQDEKTIELILEHYEQGIPLHKQAVLFRASWHSNSLELELSRRNIPFHKYGGLRFLEAAHVKDVISLLRIQQNPRDELAWFRILKLLTGVGPATAASALDHVRRNNFHPYSIAGFKAPPAASDDMAKLADLMNDLNHLKRQSPGVLMEKVSVFYIPIMQRSYENPEPRGRDVEYLARMAAGYSSLKQFLADLTLDPPNATSDLAGPPTKDDDWLILSTIHSAKGLEWDAVYLIHASDGCLPSDLATGSPEEIEEELRLTYVAMTRARDFLYVLWPLHYNLRPFGQSGRYSYVQRCRFFTNDVLSTMEQAEHGEIAVDTDKPSSSEGSGDIASRIRDIWQQDSQ
jgi:DNA helicase-2/ATP-dependent DNA helicase PcrA